MPLTKDKDGNRVWKPNKKQEVFVSLPDTILEALFGGAAGAGKTEVLLSLPIIRGFIQHPQFHGIIFRRTFPELEESLILRAPEYYEPLGGKYNSSKHFWRFESGAVIRFSYLESDQDAESHKTAQYNYIAWDELTEFGESQYTYLLSRLRSSTKELPTIVRAASNPGGPGHGWVYRRFVKQQPLGNVILRDADSGTKRIFIPARVTDNEYLELHDPDYKERLKLLPKAQRQALLEGRWDVFSGQVFTEFRTTHIPGEPDNAVHVVEPFDIPLWWPRGLAVDWGFKANTWAGWGALSPDGQIFLYREYCVAGEKVSTWAANITRISQGEPIKRTALDPSAWQHRGEDLSISELFHKYAGYWPEKANNDRVGGKLLIHEGLRWRPRPKRFNERPVDEFNYYKAQHIRRFEGEDAYNEYLDQFKEEDRNVSLPRIQIFNTCIHVIEALQACTYNPKRTEDVLEFDGDDAYDGFRYLLFLMESIREPRRQQRVLRERARIDAEFKRSGDASSYYINLKAHDLKSRNASDYPTVVPHRLKSYGVRRPRRGRRLASRIR